MAPLRASYAQSAKITSGSDDPTVIGITVQVPNDDQAGCWIGLSWSWGGGWAMTSYKGSGGGSGCEPGDPSIACGEPSSSPSSLATP
jgi:hypothetical protein